MMSFVNYLRQTQAGVESDMPLTVLNLAQRNDRPYLDSGGRRARSTKVAETPVRKLGGDGARTVNLNVLPDPHGQESCDRPWLDAPVARDAVGRRLSMPPSPPAHLQPIRAGNATVREHGLR